MPFNPDSSKNKLPSFADSAEESAFDSTIVSNTSTLKDSGFKPNTTIKSSEMNTYIRMMVSALNGIADSFGSDAAHELKADSNGQEWGDYILFGLAHLFETNYAQGAKKMVAANSAPDSISFINVGSSGKPVYFEGGVPKACNPVEYVNSVNLKAASSDCILLPSLQNDASFKDCIAFLTVTEGNAVIFSDAVKIERGLISDVCRPFLKAGLTDLSYAMLYNDSQGNLVCNFYISKASGTDNSISLESAAYSELGDKTLSVSLRRIMSIS